MCCQLYWKGLSTVTTLIINGIIIVHKITRIIFFAVSSSSVTSTTTKPYDMVSSTAFSRMNGTQVFSESLVITIIV